MGRLAARLSGPLSGMWRITVLAVVPQQARECRNGLEVNGRGARRGEELARDIRHTDCQLIVTEPAHRELLDGLAHRALLLPGVPGCRN